jgi:hypothetical protein
MKKHILLISFLIASLHSSLAQYVTIPDTTFRNILRYKHPSCFNANKEMDTTCASILMDTILNISYKHIQSLEGIQYFDSLTVLYCEGNQLRSLPLLPVSLKYLDCNSNLLRTLPVLNEGLIRINCSNNKLSTLPLLPTSLSGLNCGVNQLSTLPLLPANLSYFDCSTNLNLKCLPYLPNKLLYLTNRCLC